MKKYVIIEFSRAGIPAVNQKGDLLLLYVGIIDILQNYRLRKKLEHAFKSTLVTRVRRIHTKKIYQKNTMDFLSRRKYLYVIQAIMAIVLSDFFPVKYSVKVHVKLVFASNSSSLRSFQEVQMATHYCRIVSQIQIELLYIVVGQYRLIILCRSHLFQSL